MRQWGVALQLYVDDHKGQLPGPCPGWVRRYISPVNDATNHIFQFLAPYAGIKNISGGFVPENMICSGWVKEAPHTAVKDGSGEVYCLKSPNMQNVDIPYGYTDDSGTRKEPRFYTDVLESSRTTKSFALIDLDTEYNVEVLGGSAKTTLIPPKAVHGNHWNVLHWDWHVSNKTKAQLLDTSN
jgi:hypothetical protein